MFITHNVYVLLVSHMNKGNECALYLRIDRNKFLSLKTKLKPNIGNFIFDQKRKKI